MFEKAQALRTYAPEAAIDLWSHHFPFFAAFTAWKVLPPWHTFVCRWSEKLEDFLALIDVRVTFKNRFLLEHLAEDASDTPHVDRWSVAFESQKQLGRPVPSCDDKTGIVSDRFSVALSRLWRRTFVVARKTEVGNLKDPPVGYQDVCCLHVTVQNVRLCNC